MYNKVSQFFTFPKFPIGNEVQDEGFILEIREIFLTRKHKIQQKSY